MAHSRLQALAYLTVVNVVVYGVPAAFAQNEYQPFTLPNVSPSSYQEILDALSKNNSDPHTNIPANLEQAFCGGWDFTVDVNGVYTQEEPYCPPSADESVGSKCIDGSDNTWTKVADDTWSFDGNEMSDSDMDEQAKKTNPDLGLIPTVIGVPGRDTARAYGNLYSGFGMRREEGGNTEDIEFSELEGRRVKNGEQSGFDYPLDKATTCGLTTICRPPSHPDARTLPPSGYQNAAGRDLPNFFCDHACQRPLDNPGKPGNWKEDDSSEIQCGFQEPYTDPEDGILYSCGGYETKPPGENFCGELNANGQLAGVCQDLNNWIYILWGKLVHICLVPTPVGLMPAPVYLYEKGTCGFPAEVDTSEHSENKRNDDWFEEGQYECCSDDPYPGKTYDYSHKGTSCIPCQGEDCRIYPETNNVYINDVWLTAYDKEGPFPTDLPGGCAIGIPTDPETIVQLIANLIGAGIDPEDPGANIGIWGTPDENLRLQTEAREYISFFREYMNGGYERAELDIAADDDYKKENVPVACYGMYDMSAEDAKETPTIAEDKRCTIAGYYDADDGDGDGTNFWNMRTTQKGKGAYSLDSSDNPFADAARPFDMRKQLWWPRLQQGDTTLGAFSMINDEVFGSIFHEDFSFALLATDEAHQRATVQISPEQTLSSGALLRTPDDTITIEKDDRKERRTIVEWWHQFETEMHKNFTPPKVTLLLPTTWSIDLNPLDPLYTPPAPPEPSDRSPDIRSETIEVQVQARDDLLGDIAGFMERSLLMRIESEPIPIVVPIVNPTELRAYAQGWETWARKQNQKGLPGGAKAMGVAQMLREYADRADDVRKIRAELPRYAGAMLQEQKKVTQKLAEWVQANTEGYRTYLFYNWGTQIVQSVYQMAQNSYRDMHDVQTFPWCRNDRFTSPIYSLLDPWMPGREEEGDTTGGMKEAAECKRALSEVVPEDCDGAPISECVSECQPVLETEEFENFRNCLDLVSYARSEAGEGTWPTFNVCDEFYPPALLFPQPPDAVRDPDLVLDFTAFREPSRTIKLPVLKPVQIRINFTAVKPPALERDEEPSEYPVLAPLPVFPDGLSDDIKAALPSVIVPGGEDFDEFREAAVFGEEDDDPEDTLPKIGIPEFDLLNLLDVLVRTYILMEHMREEYDKFWTSVTMELCKEGETENCVKPGTEQDCITPYDDPKGKCVHYEFDLNERFQRLGARPAVFLKDDFRSAGSFRDPLTYGQRYCEKEDWACQLLNALSKKPREGWLIQVTDDEDPDDMIQEVRTKVRDQSSNIFENPDDQILYDMLQEQMFENFNVPEGERIETRIDPFEPPTQL